MNKFEVGDKVKRINIPYRGIDIGDIGIVKECDAVGVRLKGHDRGYKVEHFELANDTESRYKL